MPLLERRIRAIALVTAIAGASVVAPMLAAPASADAGGNQNLVQFCKEQHVQYPQISVGDCVGNNSSNGTSAGFAVAFCKAFLVPSQYPTVGDCVSTIRFYPPAQG